MLRHAIPHLFEATLAPLALFYLSLWLIGVWGALLVALGWSYLALARRVVFGQRVPGILVLAVVGLTVRTAIALASGSVFVYFLQPTLGSLTVGGAFLLSVPAGRPLAGRLAADFYPMSPEMLANVAVRRFFRRISLLWAFVNVVNAGLTIWLLVSQPLPTFVIARTAVSLGCTGGAIAVSTVWFFRSMRRHGLLKPKHARAVAA